MKAAKSMFQGRKEKNQHRELMVDVKLPFCRLTYIDISIWHATLLPPLWEVFGGWLAR